ncbi:YdcF family protein [Mariniphaga sediminis]|uniref:YdcF family protein n=1 Tax=Mariniphaga sediminis TaxID=1628158 RepID=A0A399CZK4_9BACT|nr:YdcF family protein [Mariniphaga sediminis]
MVKSRFKSIYFLRILRIFLVLSGIIFLTALLLAFTTLPFWGIHWLGTSKSGLKGEPATIILLGGGGMPSESNLMRSWHAGKAAKSFPGSKVVIAMPGNIADSLSTPLLMKKELMLRGTNPHQILFENEGTNTRSQALQCAKLLDTSKSILLVTSPEHTRRAVLSFQKTGFKKVNALPAFENATEADLSFKDDELGGRKTAVPDVGQSIQMRYQVWNHLKYEIIFAREMLALAYYKVRGWI